MNDKDEIFLRDLEITCRTFNRLTNAGVNRLSQLELLTLEEMKKWKGFGKKSLKEIENLMQNHNRYFMDQHGNNKKICKDLKCKLILLKQRISKLSCKIDLFNEELYSLLIELDALYKLELELAHEK